MFLIKKIIKYVFLNSFLFFVFLNCVDAQMSSSSYKIDADVVGVSGGVQSSENYTLEDTLGETVIGVSESGSYKDLQGFWHMVNSGISLSIDSSTLNLGTIVPGTPVLGSSVLNVISDAWGGYELYMSKNKLLTHSDTSTTISDYLCDVDSPCLWSGTGLGFSLISGTFIDAKWGTDPDYKYAAIPSSSSKVHETNIFQGLSDETIISYKVDTSSSQKSGSYSNIVTYIVVNKL